MVGVFLRTKEATSYDICQVACLLEPECMFWTFDFTVNKGNCKLYSDKLTFATSAAPNETVAGPVVCDADGENVHADTVAVLPRNR